jgi:hypothetical protein
MHNNVATPIMNFNLMKNIIFLCFHEHTNSKLNQFLFFSKEANFRVLQQWNSSPKLDGPKLQRAVD